MKTLFLPALIYYVSWIPFFVVREKVIEISIGGVLLVSSEIKHLIVYYFPITLLALIPVLLLWVSDRSKRMKKLEQRLENTEQLLSETEAKLEKKERIKYGSLTGF